MLSHIGFGLGLRAPHYQDIIHHPTKVDWFEAITENYIGLESGNGGHSIRMLERIRAEKPIALHGVSLNIGSTDPLDFHFLKKIKVLASHIQPFLLSDHFCWTGVNGENLHDLLPLPYTEEVINHLVPRILKCQEYLETRLVFENVSSYITFQHSEMSEWEFISEIAKRADCGLLIDLNNIYVNSINHKYDAKKFIQNLPYERIAQIHLAGHKNAGNYLIDTHDNFVCDEVWELYKESLKLFPHVATMVEWDSDIPPFRILEAEVLKAKKMHHLHTRSSIMTQVKNANIAA